DVFRRADPLEARRRDEDELLEEDGRGIQPVSDEGLRDECRLDLVVGDLGNERSGGAGHQVNSHVRVALVVASQKGRQPRGRGALKRTELEGAPRRTTL